MSEVILDVSIVLFFTFIFAFLYQLIGWFKKKLRKKKDKWNKNGMFTGEALTWKYRKMAIDTLKEYKYKPGECIPVTEKELSVLDSIRNEYPKGCRDYLEKLRSGKYYQEQFDKHKYKPGEAIPVTEKEFNQLARSGDRCIDESDTMTLEQLERMFKNSKPDDPDDSRLFPCDYSMSYIAPLEQLRREVEGFINERNV
jgi:hypothetical protein